MAVFNGEVTIKVEFEDFQVAVGYGYTSEIIKHKCLEQAYARSTWSKIKELRDPRFKVTVERKKVNWGKQSYAIKKINKLIQLSYLFFAQILQL